MICRAAQAVKRSGPRRGPTAAAESPAKRLGHRDRQATHAGSGRLSARPATPAFAGPLSFGPYRYLHLVPLVVDAVGTGFVVLHGLGPPQRLFVKDQTGQCGAGGCTSGYRHTSPAGGYGRCTGPAVAGSVHRASLSGQTEASRRIILRAAGPGRVARGRRRGALGAAGPCRARYAGPGLCWVRRHGRGVPGGRVPGGDAPPGGRD